MCGYGVKWMLSEHYVELNRWFQGLYYVNQDWFTYRLKLTEAEQRKLFEAFLRANSALGEIQRIFWEKEKAEIPETLKGDFVSTFLTR